MRKVKNLTGNILHISIILTTFVFSAALRSLIREQYPRVIVIGAQKAGTTWLYDVVKENNSGNSKKKELHFFNATHPVSLRKYLDDVGSLRVDFTPAYATLSLIHFMVIKFIFPKTQILFIMREPTRRFLSAVNMNYFRYNEKSDSKLVNEIQLDELKAILYSWRYQRRSFYARVIRSGRFVFGSSFHTVYFEEIISNFNILSDTLVKCGFTDVHKYSLPVASNQSKDDYKFDEFVVKHLSKEFNKDKRMVGRLVGRVPREWD